MSFIQHYMTMKFLWHKLQKWGAPQKPDEREQVIAAPPDARMIVSGGPGTGKTDTACARVVALIEHHEVSPSAIVVISFTRIAVREIAQRIERKLNNHGVTILTLDALAAYLAPELEESTDHDDQIRQTLSQLAFCAAIQHIRHLVVDEAHDVVGLRADLIEAMIAHLSPNCGVTLLSDDAQSIYDFADQSRLPKPALPHRLTEAQFARHGLTTLHRTQDPRLSQMFRQTRALVLSPTLSATAQRDQVIACLRRSVPTIPDLLPALKGDETLVLFRHRAQVVASAQSLAEAGTPFRLRLSGYPPALPAWIGLTLAEHDDPVISRARFMTQWNRKVMGTVHAVLAPEQAWAHMMAVAGDNNMVILARLRSRLLQASPPLDLSQPELGQRGPTLGTIHASKGREATCVILGLTTPNPKTTSAEENRILFVGATRAKEKLMIFEHPALPWRSLPSGRLIVTSAHSVQMEWGCDGDLTPSDLASHHLWSNREEVKNTQALLAESTGNTRFFSLDKNFNMFYNQYIICRFSSNLVRDIHSVVKPKALAMDKYKVATIGLRTMVFAPEQWKDIHYPWGQSGFLLAPVLVGHSRFVTE